jgi:ADP-ribosylglycohydrolase
MQRYVCCLRKTGSDWQTVKVTRLTHNGSRSIGGAVAVISATDLEWAPRGGRDGFQQLTGRPGFQRMKAHGKASNPQRRVQTAGVTGVSER